MPCWHAPNGTNEELYLAQKFTRVAMQSNNVDVTSNLQPELTLALERALGYGAATNSIWDLEQANCILAFNTNLTEDNNVVALPVKQAARNGAALVVIDSREVELTRHARLWLRPAPGSELLLLGGILREVLEQGLDDKEWVEEFCEDPATLLYYLNNLDLDEVSAATQVSRDDYGRGRPALWGSGQGGHLLSPWKTWPPTCAWTAPAPWLTWLCSPATWAGPAPASTPSVRGPMSRGPGTLAVFPTGCRAGAPTAAKAPAPS